MQILTNRVLKWKIGHTHEKKNIIVTWKVGYKHKSSSA